MGIYILEEKVAQTQVAESRNRLEHLPHTNIHGILTRHIPVIIKLNILRPVVQRQNQNCDVQENQRQGKPLHVVKAIKENLLQFFCADSQYDNVNSLKELKGEPCYVYYRPIIEVREQKQL